MICAKVRLGVIRYRNAMSALRPLYLDEPTSSADRLRPKSANKRHSSVTERTRSPQTGAPREPTHRR
jgi:hypothetical protein